MLTKWDELFCHQIVATFDQVGQSDRQWTEKVWFTTHDNSGRILIDAGFGRYPNRNVMDGYGGVALEDSRQYTVRVSRELRPDIETVKIGPLSYEVLEPLKKIGICLGANDYGISFDVEFEGRFPPSLEAPRDQRIRRGVVVDHLLAYYQFGCCKGKVTVEGKTYDIKKDRWWATRDHRWGVRQSIGIPPLGSPWLREDAGLPESGLQPVKYEPGGSFDSIVMQFRNYGLHLLVARAPNAKPKVNAASYLWYPYGDPRPRVRVTDVIPSFEVYPNTHKIKSGQVTITTEDGATRVVSVKPLNVFYARTGGYFGGYKGWVHGKWMGQYRIDGERVDFTDENVLEDLHGEDDVMCEYRCGDDVGYGVIEPFMEFAMSTSDA